MIDPSDRFLSTIRQSQNSATKARLQVFNALLTEEPLTMGELAAKLQGQVDRASIYRSVSLFEKLGIVNRLQIGWKYKLELSEAYNTHHHHLTCEKCGQTSPIVEDETLEISINELAYAVDFLPKSHQLEIKGICNSCQKQNSLILK